MSKFHKKLHETDEARKFTSVLARDTTAGNQEERVPAAPGEEQMWRLGTLFLVVAVGVMAALALRMEYKMRSRAIRAEIKVETLSQRIKTQREQLNTLRRALVRKPINGDQQIQVMQSQIDALISQVERNGEVISGLSERAALPTAAEKIFSLEDEWSNDGDTASTDAPSAYTEGISDAVRDRIERQE